MSTNNPFPESEAKKYLRRNHLHKYIAPYKTRFGTNLNYFGLPSAEMYDVDLWKRFLSEIVAIERESNLIPALNRKATKIGVQSNLIVLEMDIADVCQLLALESNLAESALMAMASKPMAKRIRKARQIPFHIINLDMCGGFLYPKIDSSGRVASSYEKMVRDLIAHQKRYQTSFIMVVTFAQRDQGKSHYEKFIQNTLKSLENSSLDTDALLTFFTEKKVKDQPIALRRLRFCVPAYMHNVSYNDFEVKCLHSWNYKTFYHAVLHFTPREGGSLLGSWPPQEEIIELLQTPLTKIIEKPDGSLDLIDLPLPESVLNNAD